MYFLMMFALAFAYVQFGYRFVGRTGLRVWRAKVSTGVLPWILFPLSCYENRVGLRNSFGGDADEDSYYCKAVAFVWPIMAAWSACVLSIIALRWACLVAAKVGNAVFFTGPDRMILRLAGKKRRSLRDSPILINRKLIEYHKFRKKYRKELKEINDELDIEGKFRRLEAAEKERSTG